MKLPTFTSVANPVLRAPSRTLIRYTERCCWHCSLALSLQADALPVLPPVGTKCRAAQQSVTLRFTDQCCFPVIAAMAQKQISTRICLKSLKSTALPCLAAAVKLFESSPCMDIRHQQGNQMFLQHLRPCDFNYRSSQSSSHAFTWLQAKLHLSFRRIYRAL